MKRPLYLAGLVAAAVVTMVTASGFASASPGPQHRTIEYDVALGDSLAVGFQPDAQGVGHVTDQGYADDLFAQLKAREARKGKDLVLVKLGCPDETTTTMINGGVCTYPGSTSQLDAATKFLAAHRGQVGLITLDIGSTDVENCVGATGVDTTCIAQQFGTIGANLPVITSALAKAEGTTTPTTVGVNDYDPFLASWLQGTAGQALATQSVGLLGSFNQLETAAYTQAGYKIADVATAFKVTEFTPTVSTKDFGPLPLNVAKTCELTFMCAPAPVGPNIHPNAKGYHVIANAIRAVL